MDEIQRCSYFSTVYLPALVFLSLNIISLEDVPGLGGEPLQVGVQVLLDVVLVAEKLGRVQTGSPLRIRGACSHPEAGRPPTR